MYKQHRLISLILTFLLMTLVGLFRYSSGYLAQVDLIIIIGVIILSLFLSWRQLFLVALMIILGVGFSLIFLTDQTFSNQFDLIQEHVLLSATILLIWVISAVVKQREKRYFEQALRLKTLEKFQGTTELLTEAEFKSRVHLIQSGTSRRQEHNTVVIVNVHSKTFTKNAMHHYISDVLQHTIREEYDLIMRNHAGHYIIFLQNANKAGVEKVAERFFAAIRPHLNEIDLPVTYTCYGEEDFDFDTLTPIKVGDDR